MRRLFLGRKGQSIAEYAILVTIVIGALVAVQNYVRHNLSTKIIGATDQIYSGDEATWVEHPAATLIKRDTITREGRRTTKIDNNGVTISREKRSQDDYIGSELVEDTTTTTFSAFSGGSGGGTGGSGKPDARQIPGRDEL